MKTRLGPSDILFPVPAALIATGSLDNPNLVTIAWIGIMGSKPPILAISLRKSRYSLDTIHRTGEFTVNIPTAEQFREVDYCGLVSGRSSRKMLNCGFTALPSAYVDAPIIKECPFNLECKVIRKTEFGDWIAIFAEIVETHIDAEKLDENGKIDVSKINPLVYCATIREYWSLGEKIGLGFNAGKGIGDRVNEAKD